MTYKYDDAERQSDELSDEVQDKLDKFMELKEHRLAEIYVDTFDEMPETIEQAEERLIEAIKNEGNVQF